MKKTILYFILVSFSSLPIAGFSAATTRHFVVDDKNAFDVLKLPTPTGPHRTGTAIFHFVDKSREDFITKKPGEFREMMAQLWYPAAVSKQATTAPYVPDPIILPTIIETGVDSKTANRWKDIQTHSVLNAPVIKGRLPLLLFSPGLAASRCQYTTLAEELASHGFIVAVIDHPYNGAMALPDGRILSALSDPEGGETEESSKIRAVMWAADASFVVDRLTDPRSKETARFTSHIDINRIGMLGHSLGGAAALEVCLTDKRFKAAIDMDGGFFSNVTEKGFARPTMILRSSPDYSDEDLAKKGRTREQWEKMGEKFRKPFLAILAKNESVPCYHVRVKGTGHMSFSDAPFVWTDAITRFGGRIIDARRGLEIITVLIRAFFDQHLNGKPSELLNHPEKRYPEVSLEVFGRRSTQQ
ncbi:MAG TPA: hypothetical protein VID27_08295 [Blastocatellia bacterium]